MRKAKHLPDFRHKRFSDDEQRFAFASGQDLGQTPVQAAARQFERPDFVYHDGRVATVGDGFHKPCVGCGKGGGAETKTADRDYLLSFSRRLKVDRFASLDPDKFSAERAIGLEDADKAWLPEAPFGEQRRLARTNRPVKNGYGERHAP